MAVMADEERRVISERTKAALAAARARGQKLGGDRGAVITDAIRAKAAEAKKARGAQRASDLAPIIEQAKAEGHFSLRALATYLNERHIPTPSGKGEWQAVQVSRVLASASIGS